MIDRLDSTDLFAAQGAEDTPRTIEPEASAAPAQATIGARLRAARAANGLDIAACAGRLHLPIKVLERLEADDFGEPGHFVFLRGALQGYARFLGLPPGCCDDVLRSVAPVEQPALVSVARTSPARWLLQRYGTAATYIVLTATIAVPLVVLGLRGGLERPAERIVSLDQAPAAARHRTTSSAALKTPAAASEETPLRASMTPFAAIGLGDDAAPLGSAPITPAPLPAEVTGGHTLMISANADCWFEITDADGSKVDSGMLHAGDTRTWRSAEALHVTLGNADGVSVTRDGQALPLGQYRHANVARFDVFSAQPGSGESD
jgi:cytoskeleton protein RodZ